MQGSNSGVKYWWYTYQRLPHAKKIVWQELFIQYNKDMNEEILQRLEVSEKKIDAVYESVKKIQQYFKWTFYVTIALFVLPLIILVFIMPAFISNITDIYGI